MSLIALHIEQARQTASTFDRSSNELDNLCAHLQQQWSALSSTWEGDSKHETEAEVRALLNRGGQVAQLTKERGVKVTQIADRFQAADENTPIEVPRIEWGIAILGLISGASSLQDGSLGHLLDSIITKYPTQCLPHPTDYPSRPNDDTFLVGQEVQDSCEIASLRMVLKQVTGRDYTEGELRILSNKIIMGYHNIFQFGASGTAAWTIADLVNTYLADQAKAEFYWPRDEQNLNDLEAAVKQGKGIIVGVSTEWIGTGPGHAVTIVDIKVENGIKMIYVNDPWPPGKGKKIAIPAEEFKGYWTGDVTYISPALAKGGGGGSGW